MNFYYENHVGERIQFYDSPYVLASHTFADWSLAYETVQRVSRGFHFEPATKKFKVRLLPQIQTPEDMETAFNELYDRFVGIVAKDTDYTGKLWTTNGEYLVCRITVSEKTDWKLSKHVALNCTLLSDYPVWIHDSVYEIARHEELPDANKYLDYTYDYDYDYMSSLTGQVDIVNEGYGAAGYRLEIFGSANNPYVMIDDVTISVETTLGADQYLVIDSRTRSVYTVNKNGTVINQFNNRNKTQSIFSGITTGRHSLIYPGTFGFNLTVYEERREPKWS